MAAHRPRFKAGRALPPEKLRPILRKYRDNGVEVCLRLCVICRPTMDEAVRATQALFIVTGIPVAREGFVLSLPLMNIEVAAECSGIRSTMMLLLTSMVLGHLFLASAWRQGILLVATVLITVLKNALRIYTLSMLAMYVDPSWIEGKFHHVYGGSVFFALALAMVFVLIKFLRRSEREPMAVRGLARDEVGVS